MENIATLESLIEGKSISDARKKTILLAISAGAEEPILRAIVDAALVRRGPTVNLPPDHLESLSRGRGWCRSGAGADAKWAEKTDKGYSVGPGKWTVGATDGFSRKKSTSWIVRHVSVGSETWTVAE